MLKTFRFSVLLAALVISAGSGSAAVFHYDFSIVPDPSLLQVHPSGYPDWYMYEQYFSGTTPLTVQAGDEITGTISFADGYSFRIDNTANVYAWGASVDFFGRGQTAFRGSDFVLGLTGNLGESNPTTGNTLYGNDVVGAGIGYVAGQNFSFTGVQYTIDIISLTDDTTSVAGAVPFSFGRLSIVADQVSLEQAAPEPATGFLAIPLMLLPCIRALRRRRA